MTHLLWVVSYVAAWGLGLAQLSAAFGMFWAVGRINSKKDPDAKVLITDEGPPIDSPFPWFEAHGEQMVFCSDDYKGREWVLLMLSPECEPCYHLLKTGIRSALKDWDTSIKLVVVLEGEAAEQSLSVLPSHSSIECIVDKQTMVRHKLDVENTPYGFLMDASGTVRMKGVVNNSNQLLGLSQANGQHMDGARWQEETV